MTRGIVLIALGHANYGNYAFNLLASIRAANATIPVAVVAEESSLAHLTEAKKAMFSHIIGCDAACYTHNGKLNYVKAKLYLDHLSPFDETIFLDVDTCWIPLQDPDKLFESLKSSDFQIKNTGYYDVATKTRHDNNKYTYWNKPELICSTYCITKTLPCCQGEFFYFRKSVQATAIFDAARQVFDEQKLSTSEAFAGCLMNDEFAFNIAIALCGYKLPQVPFVPTYWSYLDGFRMTRTDIHKKYYAVSVGGTSVAGMAVSHYNDIIAWAFNKIGLQHPFLFKEKTAFLPERRM